MSLEQRASQPDKPGKEKKTGQNDRQTTHAEQTGLRAQRATELYVKGKGKEKAIPRSRGQIQQELTAVQAQLDNKDQEKDAYGDRIDQLSDEQRDSFYELVEAVVAGDPIDDKIGEIDPLVNSLISDTRPLIEETCALEEQEKALKAEALPYLKEETEQAARKLLARIDYHGMFAYYREIAKGERESEGSTDFLQRTIGEMHGVRKYGYEASQPSEGKDYDYFNGAQLLLRESEALWERRGFLRKDADEAEEEAAFAIDESAKERREKILRDVITADDNLNEYRWLIDTYRPGAIVHKDHVDKELWALRTAFDEESFNDHYRESFDEIDFDPRLLAAAENYVENKLLEHRRAGRLPKTDAILAEESQQRYHETDLDTAYDHIAFHGFEPPEGMVSVFDQEAFIEHAKKTFPPDFVDGLESISYIPDYVQDPDSPYDIDGRMIPVFGEGDQKDIIISRKMELYASPFIPETTDALEQFIAASFFRDTPNHEIMHNAHNLADFDEMKAWEKVTESDPTAIDPYVNQSRGISKRKGQFEDFAVSGEFYTAKPLILFCLSEERFRYMDWFFKRHLPYQQQAVFDYERESKMDAELRALMKQYPDKKSFDEIKEAVRKTYLSHEQED